MAMRTGWVMRAAMGVAVLGMYSGNFEGQRRGLPPEAAANAAHQTGKNYEWGVVCKAGPELLAAYKAKFQVAFASAGPRFEPEFAAGRTEAQGDWKGLTAKLGEPKARETVCQGSKYVAGMQAAVARK
jgi:hypothetical protein